LVIIKPPYCVAQSRRAESAGDCQRRAKEKHGDLSDHPTALERGAADNPKLAMPTPMLRAIGQRPSKPLF
jgi:hypothetical protein